MYIIFSNQTLWRSMNFQMNDILLQNCIFCHDNLQQWSHNIYIYIYISVFIRNFRCLPKINCQKNRFSKISDTLKLPEKVSGCGIIDNCKKNTQMKSVLFSAHLFMILILKVRVKFCIFEREPNPVRTLISLDSLKHAFYTSLFSQVLHLFMYKCFTYNQYFHQVSPLIFKLYKIRSGQFVYETVHLNPIC